MSALYHKRDSAIDNQFYVIALGALFYSPVDFTDASDLNTLMQV